METEHYYERLEEDHVKVTTGAKPCYCFFQLCYPFFSVPLIVLATLYTVMLVTFISISASLFFSAENIPIGWDVYFIIFIVFSLVSNISVISIGYIGLSVFFVILCTIPILLFFGVFMLLVYCFCLTTQSSGGNSRRN